MDPRLPEGEQSYGKSREKKIRQPQFHTDIFQKDIPPHIHLLSMNRKPGSSSDLKQSPANDDQPKKP